MIQERRKKSRVPSHLSLEMVNRERGERYQGYVENLTDEGIGILAFDYIMPKTLLSCEFLVGGNTIKVKTAATVTHVRKDLGMMYYYGCQINYLSANDREVIQTFIKIKSQATV